MQLVDLRALVDERQRRTGGHARGQPVEVVVHRGDGDRGAGRGRLGGAGATPTDPRTTVAASSATRDGRSEMTCRPPIGDANRVGGPIDGCRNAPLSTRLIPRQGHLAWPQRAASPQAMRAWSAGLRLTKRPCPAGARPLAVLDHDRAARQHDVGAALDLASFVAAVVHVHVVGGGGDRVPAVRVVDHEVRVRSRPRPHPCGDTSRTAWPGSWRSTSTQRSLREAAAHDAAVVEQVDAVLDARAARWGPCGSRRGPAPSGHGNRTGSGRSPRPGGRP